MQLNNYLKSLSVKNIFRYVHFSELTQALKCSAVHMLHYGQDSHLRTQSRLG